jgi:hypothetical protein
VQHDIRLDDLQEMKYYADDEADQSTFVIDGDDDDMAFLAMHINPTQANGLSTYSTSYDPTPRSTNAAKKYITVEFRSQDEFRKMLNKLRKDQHLEAFMSSDSKICSSQIKTYAAALLQHSEEEKEDRTSSLSTRGRRHGVKKKKRETNEVLLVYPSTALDAYEDEIAADLHEASLRPIAATTHSNIVEDEDVPLLDNGVEGEDMDSKPAAAPIGAIMIANAAKHVGAAAMALVSWSEHPLPSESGPEAQETDRQPPIRAESIVSEVNSAKALDQDKAKAGKSGHRHFLTIREEDRERLDPTIYLNDTLVDFWMQW